jgi:site-specific recombinase XerD
MIEYYVKRSYAVDRLRGGAAGQWLDGFAKTLAAVGYSRHSGREHIHNAHRLLEWATSHGIRIGHLDEDALDRFARYLARHFCRDTSILSPGRSKRFLAHLRDSGERVASFQKACEHRLVDGYRAWLIHHRGLSGGGIYQHVRISAALLDSVGQDVRRINAIALRAFVSARARAHERHSIGGVTTTLRSFLRYLVVRGKCSPVLIDAVPSIAQWRLSSLPRHLPAKSVERLVAANDRRKPDGIRDRAMLLLLARLGLRPGEVVRLRLGDLDWHRGRIRIIGKGAKESWLPLPQDVGDAILEYLRRARPRFGKDHLFLRLVAPFRPLDSASLSTRVSEAMRRAGVESHSRGAHVLRHSLATTMLREGASLDAIGAVLRHRRIDTTAIYSKVDIDLLKRVAQPWPSSRVRHAW